MNQKSSALTIRNLPYFRELNSDEIAQAEHSLNRVAFAAGEELFHQGDSGAWLYLLGRGEVEIRVRVENEQDAALCVLRPPALIGEMSILLEEVRSASAVALDEVETWQISRAEFLRALHDGEAWAGRLLLATSKMLAARLADANGKLVTLLAQQEHTSSGQQQTDELQKLRSRLFLS